MKFAKRLAIAVIGVLPIITIATAIAAQASPWGSSFFGLYQPEFPKD